MDLVLERMSEAARYNSWLLDRARPFLGRSILDLGAGLGTFTARLAEGHQVTALEHIADDAAALRAVHARLCPGGHLLPLVPSHPLLFGAIDRGVGHERRCTKGGLQRLIVQAGFGTVALRRVNPIGALGWLFVGRILRRPSIPAQPLRLFDSSVPLLRALDRVELPFGLSLWAVAQRPDSSLRPNTIGAASTSVAKAKK